MLLSTIINEFKGSFFRIYNENLQKPRVHIKAMEGNRRRYENIMRLEMKEIK